jgi:hypothetical protein
MSRRAYTDEDRATVKLALEINKGNIKATHRDTGVPYMTIKAWKDKWEDEGVPAEVSDALPAIATDFVEEGVQVRDAALLKIKELIPKSRIQDLRSLATLVGILDDKVRLAQGLATSRSEAVHIHVDPEEIGNQIGSHIRAALESDSQRADEIIDVEAVEQAEDQDSFALPVRV